jgi:pimeloyl-ACP methyl ester carboxylesterase
LTGDSRPRALALIGLGLAGFVLGLGFAFRASVAAQLRTVGVLAASLETPVVSPGVRALTDAPRFTERRLAGLATTEVRPGGDGPWPTVLFVNGATPDGRRNPQVRRLAAGLARTGHLVLVPDLPGLRTGELSVSTLDATLDAGRAAAAHGDAEDGKVALVGVSAGASLALVAAQTRALRDRVSVVAGVAPYADMENVLRIATTHTYEANGRLRRFTPEPFLRLVVARSLVAALPPGADRAVLARAVEAIGAGRVPNPLALAVLGPEGRAVGALLLNRDPARFDPLYGALPGGVRERLERLSPIRGAPLIRAPVELVSAPRDKYFPLHESRQLARAAVDARVTETSALDHADLRPSLRELPELLALNGFVRRTLRLAQDG